MPPKLDPFNTNRDYFYHAHPFIEVYSFPRNPCIPIVMHAWLVWSNVVKCGTRLAGKETNNVGGLLIWHPPDLLSHIIVPQTWVYTMVYMWRCACWTETWLSQESMFSTSQEETILFSPFSLNMFSMHKHDIMTHPSQVRVMSGSHSKVQHTKTTVSWPWRILVKVLMPCSA